MKIEIPATWLDNQDAARKYHGAEYDLKAQPFREKIRAAMQGGATFEAAVGLELAAAEKGQQPTTMQMLVLAAACDVADGMETPVEERLAVAEAEAPVKEKGKKKGSKARPGRERAGVAGWAGGVGKRGIVVQLKPPEGRELFGWLQEILTSLKFQAGPGALRSGTTLPDSMLDVDFDLRHRWILKDTMACFGWREDARKVSGGAIKRVTQERMREQGETSKAAEKQIRQMVQDDLMSRAIPSTTHAVCVVHADGWMLWGGSLKGLDMFIEKIGSDAAGSALYEVPTLEKKIGWRSTADGWARLDLRAADGQARNSDGSPDRIWTFGQLTWDFLLWLTVPDELGRKVEWSDKDGALRDATWKPEGNFSLVVAGGATRKPENVTIKGQDSTALIASLAAGGSITGMRVKLEESWDVADASTPGVEATLQNSRAYEFSLNRSGLILGSLKLPKAGYGAAGVAWERTQLLRQLDSIIVELFRAYMAERERTWGSFVERARRWLGLELVRRFAFDPATGQGLLFQPLGMPAIEDKAARRARK